MNRELFTSTIIQYQQAILEAQAGLENLQTKYDVLYPEDYKIASASLDDQLEHDDLLIKIAEQKDRISTYTERLVNLKPPSGK